MYAKNINALLGQREEHLRHLPERTIPLIEIGLLFATLAAIGPLVRSSSESSANNSSSFGLAEFPG